MSRRLVIIGAGPMGLTAGVEGLQRGFDVAVLERDSVGSSLLRWGPTRFFTPVSMNVARSFRDILGAALPSDSELLTGPEMVERVLRPIAEGPLRGRVLTGHRVTSVGRKGLTRGDFPGHPIRSERPFVIVAQGPEGELRLEADVLFDASGGYWMPTSIGSGGLPARGERAASERTIRHLGDLHTALDSLAEKRILVIGHGHSAAHAVVVLGELAQRAAGTSIVWAVRTMNRRPCAEIADDPLPERQSVARQANDLAAEPPPFLSVIRRASVEAIDPAGHGVRVRLTDGQDVEVDSIAAFTGHRPDLSFLSELPLEISPVTEGPARLYRAVSNITDCLSVPAVSPEDLQSGESGFYFVGSKSYGRAPTFLLQTGLQHLEAAFRMIGHS